jgi:uncharacterized protein YbaR (Trm112 family)
MDECPICMESLTGTLATLGCCHKIMHVECLIKCMKQNLSCPMCRTVHESLSVVQDTQTNVFVGIPDRTRRVYRDCFAMTLLTSVVAISVSGYYF